MLLAFVKARFKHFFVMSTTRFEASEHRASAMVADIEQKLKVYSLGMVESTDILDYLAESARTYQGAISAETLDRVGNLVLAAGKAEPASAATAEVEAADKQKHAHGEAYLTTSEWEMLRDVKITLPNKARPCMHM